MELFKMNLSRRSFMKSAAAVAGGAVVITRLPELKAENLPIKLPETEVAREIINPRSIDNEAQVYGSICKTIYASGECCINGVNVGNYVLDLFTPFFFGPKDICWLQRDDETLLLKINGVTCVNLPMQGERFVFVYMNVRDVLRADAVQQDIYKPSIVRIDMREL